MPKANKRGEPRQSQATCALASSKEKASPPAPYSPPPPVLRPFLETLNPAHVYITHVDVHPRSLKRRVFSVPVIMNIVIGALLMLRAHFAIPHYLYLAQVAFGTQKDPTVAAARGSFQNMLVLLASRTGLLMFDFVLINFVLQWPMDFFIGDRSPFNWRRQIGFLDEEVIVRRSRSWDQQLPKDWLAEEADGLVYKERIMPALDQKHVREKTGYLMMNSNWELDFAAMILAHELLKEDKAAVSDFRKMLVVYSEEHGWLIWPVWRLDEGAHEESRKKIVLFKDRLTAMGKENLFFKWIELIQFESTQPGGFTPERQRIAMERARELFEEQGVHFDQFWKNVGGFEGLPGMEIAL